MIKAGKKLAAIFLMAAMVVSCIPEWGIQTVYADDTPEITAGVPISGDALNGVTVRFRPNNSHKTVTINKDGSSDGDHRSLHLYYLGHTSRFYLEKAGDDSYRIYYYKKTEDCRPKRDGDCLVDGEGTKEGAAIHMMPTNDNDNNYEWKLIPQADGTYYIQSRKCGKYWSLKDVDDINDNKNQLKQRAVPMKWRLEIVTTDIYASDKKTKTQNTSMAEAKRYDSYNIKCNGETVTSLNWMSMLPDDTSVADLNIPGTHDAGTCNVSSPSGKRCQQIYMDEILRAGVRHIDLRIGKKDGQLNIVHSDDDCYERNGSRLSLQSAMQWFYDFLDENPGETIILQIKDDYDNNGTTRGIYTYYKNLVLNRSKYIWVGDHVPKLSEARGKIILISRLLPKYLADGDSTNYNVTRNGKVCQWAIDARGYKGSEDEKPAKCATGSDFELWVQDNYSHPAHSAWDFINTGKDTIIKTSLDGKHSMSAHHTAAAANNKKTWCLCYTSCSYGPAYTSFDNAKTIHQWLFRQDWFTEGLYTGVLANNFIDEDLSQRVYRSNFTSGTKGWEYNDEHVRIWRGPGGHLASEAPIGEPEITETITKEPTCTEKGVKETVTTGTYKSVPHKVILGRTETQVRALGHDFTEYDYIPPTCIEPGYRFYECSRCPYVTSVTEPATGHTRGDFVRENEILATDTKPGSYDDVVYCKVCREELYREHVTVPVGECHHSETETVEETLVEATCTTPRYYYRIRRCAACKERLHPQFLRSDPLGHTWTELEYSWSDDNGTVTATHICEVCNTEETETVNTTAEVSLEPTCTEKGNTTYTSEEFTKDGFEVQEKTLDNLDPPGHVWNDGAVTREPSCVGEGEITYECSGCGETMTELIPPTGHVFASTEVTKPAGFEEDGEFKVVCTECGEEDSEIIPKISRISLTDDSFVYDGKAKEPQVIAADEEENIIDSEEYDVTWSNNTNAGTATARVTFKGERYEGSRDLTYKIKKAVPAVKAPAAKVLTENGRAQKLVKAGSTTDGKLYYAVTEENKAPNAGRYTTSIPAGTDEGTYYVWYMVRGDANHKNTDPVCIRVTIKPRPVGPGASAAAADKAITSMKTDTDPEGTVFAKLKMKSPEQTKTSIRLRWTKVSKAKKYVLYGSKCGKGNKPVKLATVTGKTRNIKKIRGKKIKKGTYYKFIVVALDKNNKVVSVSKLIHVVTKGGKTGNHKSVTVGKAVLAKAKKLKKGKSLKLNARAVPQSAKHKVRIHVKVRYESTNNKIATVTKKGLVKAVKKGTCYVYAYAQNGVFRKIKVVVK